MSRPKFGRVTHSWCTCTANKLCWICTNRFKEPWNEAVQIHNKEVRKYVRSPKLGERKRSVSSVWRASRGGEKAK